MSGESGGFILGAALALPVVAAAGVGLVAYGAAKATVAVAKGAYNLYRAHENEVQLQLTSTNSNIDQFYQTLDTVLQNQAAQTANAIAQAQASIASASQSITNIPNDPEHAAQWHQTVLLESNVLYQNTQKAIAKAAHDNQIAAEATIAKAKATLDAQLKLQFDAENLMKGDATKREKLAQTVKTLLAQCTAAISQLSTRDTNGLIRGELDAYQMSLETAQAAVFHGQYEMALSSAQTLLSETAALSCTLARREENRWQHLFEAHLILDSVRNQLLETESMTFTNPHTHKAETLYPDDFIGGRLDEMLELVTGKLHQLELAMGVTRPADDEEVPAITPAEADILTQNVQDVVIPEMHALLEEATTQMAAYVDRIHCLDVISKELSAKTSYQLKWTMPEGGDLTAPITMHLSNPITGDEVTVKLETDPISGRIDMNTYSYGGPNHQIDEHQRNHFYQLVVNSLCKADPSVVAALTCNKATENQYATQTEYATSQTVQNLPEAPIPVLNSTAVLA